jgi:putative membrane protein
MSSFGGDARIGGGRAAAGVVALLLTSMHMTLLGALLALGSRPLYGHAMAHPGWTIMHPELGGATPLDEQHLGGAIMLLVGGISYLAGGLWLSSALLVTRARAQGEPG